MEFKHPKTKAILGWFEEINKIPRCSKNEAAICDWLVSWATGHKLVARTDRARNLVIEVPASPGYERSTTAILQGHMDMVCEKTRDSTHDFAKDPIKPVIKDGWVHARDTTLGADNGIALAMALCVAESRDLPHPPLELLFTVDEETGLTGANALESDFIKGKILLNLDSEDEGVFTVGCAGGRDTRVTLPVQFHPAPASSRAFLLSAGGMRGGHSGVDIAKLHANAIKVLTRALTCLQKKFDLRISSLTGGSAHNAIPRDAEALVILPESVSEAALATVAELEKILQSEFKPTDPDLRLRLAPAQASDCLTPEATGHVLDFLLAFPHGVASMSRDVPGLVETSNNLATIKTQRSSIQIHSSQRSSSMDRLTLITDKIEALARLGGAVAESGTGYPSWKPNMSSALLKRCQEVYRELFHKEPVVEIIHAGLECGIIGSKVSGMDMISFGPTIKSPHSPEERLEVDSIGKVWDFLTALLKSLK